MLEKSREEEYLITPLQTWLRKETLKGDCNTLNSSSHLNYLSNFSLKKKLLTCLLLFYNLERTCISIRN